MKQPDIKNQKVFVTLSSVTEVQKEFIRLRNEVIRIRKETSYAAAANTNEVVRGMAKVIQTLGLPIDIHS